MKYLKPAQLLLAGAVLAPSSLLYATPVVSGNTINWLDDGWYQVQDMEDFSQVCAGGRSCQVSPGTYVVINHTTGVRYSNLVVSDTDVGSTATVSVQGNSISWPDDGWYQVLDGQNFTEVCGGGLSCSVPEGNYLVINHTTGERYDDILVGNDAATAITDSQSDSASASGTDNGITITDNVISWSDDGWYQVQSADTFNSICQGGFDCPVADGSYIVINHTTGQRWENVEVDAGNTVVADDTSSVDADAADTEVSGDNVTDTVSASNTGTTDGVVCDYVDSTFNDSASVNATSTSQWSCSDTERLLTANGLPDHSVGVFPNPANPNTMTEQTVSASYTLSPQLTDNATQLGGPAGTVGFILNGIKIDAGTGGSCDDTGETCSLGGNVGSWSIEALTQSYFDFGTDENNAHVQPGGIYHYHGMPEGFIEKQGGGPSTMTLIGWAADGFPIYARYGYTNANDSTSGLKVLAGSYQLVSQVPSNRPATDLYELGTFLQDWEYVEGSGDLDECNGRTGVTPEFPGGIYHYFATDSYPYLIRCVKGEVAGGDNRPPRG